MRTNIALKGVLGNHLDIDSGVQKIKGMFFINKHNEKCINLFFTNLGDFNSGSHEILMSFSFGRKKYNFVSFF